MRAVARTLLTAVLVAAGSAASSDVLELANGGRLNGSLVELGFLVKGQTTTYPRDRVKSFWVSQAAKADSLTLADGQTVKGELVSIRFRTIGGLMTFRRNQILTVTFGPSPADLARQELAKRRAAVKPGDADALCKLARWAHGKGLEAETAELARAALDAAPDAPAAAEAHELLGHVQYKGEWMTRVERLKRRQADQKSPADPPDNPTGKTPDLPAKPPADDTAKKPPDDTATKPPDDPAKPPHGNNRPDDPEKKPPPADPAKIKEALARNDELLTAYYARVEDKKKEAYGVVQEKHAEEWKKRTEDVEKVKKELLDVYTERKRGADMLRRSLQAQYAKARDIEDRIEREYGKNSRYAHDIARLKGQYDAVNGERLKLAKVIRQTQAKVDAIVERRRARMKLAHRQIETTLRSGRLIDVGDMMDHYEKILGEE